MKPILDESGDAWRQRLLNRYVDGRATLSFYAHVDVSMLKVLVYGMRTT